MSSVYRANRKAEDAEIIRLNSIGLSLATIANELNCHPSTVTLRLKSLGIPPADTRRTFMEDVLLGMTYEQKLWLIDVMADGRDLKEYVRGLPVTQFNRQKEKQNEASEHTG